MSKDPNEENVSGEVAGNGGADEGVVGEPPAGGHVSGERLPGDGVADADDTDDDYNEQAEDALWALKLLKLAGYVTEQVVDQLIDEAAKAGEPLQVPGEPLGATLDWLIAHGHTDAQTAQAVTERMVGEWRAGAIPGGLFVAPELATLDPRLDDALKRYFKRLQRRAKLKSALVGVGVLAVIGGIVWWQMFPPTPFCNASTIRKTLSSIAFSAGLAETSHARRNPFLPHEHTPTLSFGDGTEVAYDKDSGMRGCRAHLLVDDKDSGEEIGYVVKRQPDDRREFRVETMPVEFLTARFTAAALNMKLGAPVGRDAMRAAIAAGLQNLDKKLNRYLLAHAKMLTDDPAPVTEFESVGEMRPTADCRRLDGGRYSCPVQFEYHDGDLERLGMYSYRVFDADVAFEPDGNGWKVADDFDDTFMQAVAESRRDPDDKPKPAAPPKATQ